MRVIGITLALLLCIDCINVCAVEKRECVVKNYRSQIGVREDTGANDGEEVGDYLRTTGLGEGYAWCAAFVNWAMVRECIDTPESAAWSPAWFTRETTVFDRRKSTYAEASVDQGDVFGIYFSSKKRIAHVGFIDEWGSGDYAITVEGNTNKVGSREGDGVYRKRRHKRQIYKVANWIDR